MYLKLQGKVDIVGRPDGANAGRTLRFVSFNSIETELDIFKINTSCKIKIPTTARLSNNGLYALNSMQTARAFERGDRVTVWLGYNGNLEQEFTGFIYRINYTSPLEIECEGFEFQLRRACETKTWRKTNIKEVLQYLITGTDIVLSDKIQDIDFTKFVLPANMSCLEALQMVKEKYGLTIFFDGNVLYAGLAYVIDSGVVKYELGWNTIKDNDLKYRNADDVSMKVKAVWIKPDNTKVEVEVGDPEGSQRTLFFYDVGSKEHLKAMATQEIKKYKYSGYEGKITTFLIPFAKPGMKGELGDPKYDERKGTYYITKIGVKADRSGGRRTVSFTIKL